MSEQSEEKDNFSFSNIKLNSLQTEEEIPLWLIRARAALESRNWWDVDTNLPVNNPQSNYILLSALSNYFLEQIADSDLFATTIWTHVKGINSKSNLSTKSTALLELVSFTYSEKTINLNKTALQGINRRLKSAFADTALLPTGKLASIDSSKRTKAVIYIDDLVTLFSLVTLPVQYHSLRSTLEETSASNLTFDSLFLSLAREEQSQSFSSANKVQKSSKVQPVANRAAAKSTISVQQCPHKRTLSECYTCTPSSRPICSLCKAKGIAKFNHVTGNEYCKFQQFLYGQSTANAVTSVRFNPDSACTDHIVTDNKSVEMYSSLSRPIQVASGEFVQTTGIGKLCSPILPLNTVLICDKITENLLSISKLAETGLDTLFTSKGVFIGVGGSLKETQLAGHKCGPTYSLEIPLLPSSEALSIKSSSMMDWHKRLNHLNVSDISRMSKETAVIGLTVNPNEELPECIPCLTGKARHGSGNSHPSTFIPKRCGELVLMDIAGPIEPLSHRGFKYVLLISDVFSGFVSIYLLKFKSEALQWFTKFNNQLHTRTGHNVINLRSDNEFRTKLFNSYCVERGIVQQFIVPYESQQMGNGERINLTLFNPVRAILIESNMGKEFWCDAALTVIYTRNMSLSSSNPTKTPFEMWFGHKPVVSHLAIFGSLCYAFISAPYRKKTGTTKLADRATACRFLGYSQDSKSYQLLRVHDNAVVIALYNNVRFSNLPSQPLSDGTNESEFELVRSKGATRKRFTAPVSPISSSNYYSAIEDCNSQDTGSINDDNIAEGIDQDLDSLNVPAAAVIAAQESIRRMARNPFRNVENPPLSSSTPSFSSFRGAYVPPGQSIHPIEPANAIPLASPLVQNKSSFVLQDTSEPAAKDITARVSSNSKRNRNVVNYAEANSLKTTAYTALVTRLHAGFSSVDTVVQLTNNGHHQWYRTKAYSSQIPHSYKDIATNDAAEEWYKATDDEIAQLIKFETWQLVPRPEGNVLKNKWVFRIKEKDGTVIRYKARLCACGYSQVAGIDYKDLFSPTVQSASFRLQLALIAERGMKTKQLDVTGAFLYGVPEEVLHMEQIQGYEDKNHPDWVCLLLRNLYGLKQAPRTWHLTIDPFIKSLGFTANDGDPCLYQRWVDQKLFIIALHVDDMLLAADCSVQLDDISHKFKSQFTMTDDGEVSRILGLTISRNLLQSTITISQPDAIQSLLTKFNMLDCAPVSTPIESLTVSSHDCPPMNSDAQFEMTKIPYREACGSLMALAVNSRPEICFAVGVACRYMHNPGLPHWNLVKRIFRYLKGSQYLKLTLGGLTSGLSAFRSTKVTLLNGHNHLLGVSDSDWAGDKDHARSTTGYLFYWGTSLLSWGSKLQATVSSSSTMAEYIATYTATLEALWLRTVLVSLNLLTEDCTIPILCDNSGAISLSKFHMTTNRTKHIETKFHLVRENVLAGKIQLQTVPTAENVADIFTKPLPRSTFLKHRASLGLE